MGHRLHEFSWVFKSLKTHAPRVCSIRTIGVLILLQALLKLQYKVEDELIIC